MTGVRFSVVQVEFVFVLVVFEVVSLVVIVVEVVVDVLMIDVLVEVVVLVVFDVQKMVWHLLIYKKMLSNSTRIRYFTKFGDTFLDEIVQILVKISSVCRCG
ncbi:hypothetical protein A2U01_0051035 [Trifolium medium]|uniref:Uncharacterized protein n=1 Tax=Trifolium medium TaxID=97028 RepID=A0A392R1X3_9FABA|nr:hypothetical protein [Trifolium medium]